MKDCKQCQSSFKITDEDLRFYKKLDVPDPTCCPSCRQQRRLAWRNEATVYKRNCDKTGESIFSIYPKDSPFPVYSPISWFGDDWDPTDYSQEYDFNRPFFEQFTELQNKVPRISNIQDSTENCDYCNIIADCKNCYLIYGCVDNEDCMYGSPYYSKNCIDSLMLKKGQWCYECIDSNDLYECQYSQNCKNSQGLQFCFDLEGCKNCFLCAGLRQKEYYILNKECSERDYFKKVDELKQKGSKQLMKELQSLKKNMPVKFMNGFNNENVTGNHVYNSKNTHNAFYTDDCEDVCYVNQLSNNNNCMDCDVGEYSEFIYENSGFYKTSNLKFCHWCWEVSDLFYCSTCTMNTTNCFGCISLKHKKYCILNKQYTKEEYEEMLQRIIEHIKSTGEYGQFFPIECSPFAYNETIAQYYYPLDKDIAVKNGWRWKDDIDVQPNVSKVIPAQRLPNDIKDIPDDILNWAIECDTTKRLFKINTQELQFYRKFNLEVPRLHPSERHLKRNKLRNPMRLWDRKCDKCSFDIKTAYAPDRSEKVFCAECYLKEIY